MRVVTFAPSLTAVEAEDGGLILKGFPMTSAFVDVFPAEITIPVVLVVAAVCGDEYDPMLYITATSPRGERLSTMQFGWRWDDLADSLVKFRVFAQQLPVQIESDGVYTLSVYENLDDAEPDATFPLPVFMNPAMGGRITVDIPRL